MEPFLTLFLLCPFAFFITVTSGQDTVCLKPKLDNNIAIDELQMYFSPGMEIVLSCKQGYTPVSGPRKIVCTASGEWTKTKLFCTPKRCPYPEPPTNGDVYYEDVVYQSTINYTCNEGYSLTGPSAAECLANGTWSSPAPECDLSANCGLAPIPEFGMITYDRMISGNTTKFGDRGTYRCRPPYVLFGNARAECTIGGTWTKTPECRVVTCPPPENIENGYMSTNDQRDYDFMETIKYGCQGDYKLEGNLQIICQESGQWSDKPFCRAPCTVGVERGRILYRGKKMWIGDLSPNKVSHKEVVSVYCLNKERNCGYAAPTQCINGNLEIPNCYEEPSSFTYNMKPGSLPSEIAQC